MMKLTVYPVIALLVLISSILISSCHQQPKASLSPIENESLSPVKNKSLSLVESESWSPKENDAGWTLFTNSNKIKKLLTAGTSLWTATSGGVVKWDMDKGTYRKYITLDGLFSNDIRSLARDNQGNLWFGGVNAVSRFDGTHWRTFTNQDGLASGIVNDILQDSQGFIWFATSNGGVNSYDGTNWRTFTNRTAWQKAALMTFSRITKATCGLALATLVGVGGLAGMMVPAGVRSQPGTDWQQILSYLLFRITTVTSGLADDWFEPL